MKTPEEKREYQKQWYEANKERLLAKHKSNYDSDKRKEQYKEKDRVVENEKRKTYVAKNKDLIKQRQKEYYQANKDKIKQYDKNRRELKNVQEKERKLNNPLYKLKKNMRTLLTNSISRNGFKKLSRTEQILGCSFEDFKLYLESKFESWMTWENRGLYNGQPNYGWDVDHIIPLASATNEIELLKLNHYTNLQPLCSYINRDVKRDNI